MSKQRLKSTTVVPALLWVPFNLIIGFGGSLACARKVATSQSVSSSPDALKKIVQSCSFDEYLPYLEKYRSGSVVTASKPQLKVVRGASTIRFFELEYAGGASTAAPFPDKGSISVLAAWEGVIIFRLP